MDWHLTGTILVACNCDWGCPCNFNALPSRGYCQGGWLWAIERGHVEDVRLDGLHVALYSNWPGAIHHGNGHAVCYVDDRADDAQRAVLSRLLNGDIGGPWQIFIKTYQLSDPIVAPFAVELAEYNTHVRIGDNVHLELTTLRNPVTGADIHPEMILPEGLIMKRGRLAATREFCVTDTISYDHSGQYAAFGAFDYGP